MELELIRDVLDKQVVDRHRTKMGRVDGIVVRLTDGQPPQIDHLELGFAVLARRIHPRVERWVEAIRRRVRVRKEAVQTVQWSAVGEINSDHVAVDIDAQHTPAFAWERWLRDHIVAHLPGGSEE